MKPTTIPADAAAKLHLQGVHLELTAALQQNLREKFMGLLRHNPYIVSLDVRLQEDQKLGGERHYTATGRIEIGGPDLAASSDGLDARDVVDRLVDKLNQQLRKRHSRRKSRRNHPHGTELGAELPKARPVRSSG